MESRNDDSRSELEMGANAIYYHLLRYQSILSRESRNTFQKGKRRRKNPFQYFQIDVCTPLDFRNPAAKLDDVGDGTGKILDRD